jgi:chromosome segregation ATPase
LKQELQQTEAQLQHAKNELKKYAIKKQRADNDLAIYETNVADNKAKLAKDFSRLKNNYELDIAAYPTVIKDLKDQEATVNQSILDAIGELKTIQSKIDEANIVVAGLNEQKDNILIEIEDADNSLTELDELIAEKTDGLKATITLHTNAEVQLEATKVAILAAEEELTELRADLATRKNAKEDDMKITIQKSTDVVKRLIELEKREAKINNDITARTKAVELREQVIARREAKIAGMEQKAQEYARFMKL